MFGATLGRAFLLGCTECGALLTRPTRAELDVAQGRLLDGAGPGPGEAENLRVVSLSAGRDQANLGIRRQLTID